MEEIDQLAVQKKIKSYAFPKPCYTLISQDEP